jgi:hypothetical protein
VRELDQPLYLDGLGLHASPGWPGLWRQGGKAGKGAFA